jgi:hypothetical protein
VAADDAVVERLAGLFGGHPAWVRAARYLSDDASSSVYFSHRPGEVWRLLQVGGVTRLLPGAADDPDFVFRFTPQAVDRLEAVQGGIGDFAVALFELVLAEDPRLRVGLRIAAPFGRLVRRGYLGLLVAAGPRVLAFGGAHGIRSLGALRRFVADIRSRVPADWETGCGGSDPGR